VHLGNSSQSYGWINILLHWLLAVAIFGMFGLGLWMKDLDYYDPWYNRGPDLHRSIGVTLLCFFVVRLLWWGFNEKPLVILSHKRWETVLAKSIQHLFYLLVLCMAVSGYLITTADGRSLHVFDWFEIPSLISTVTNLEDVAGAIHETLAWLFVTLVTIHVLGAVKHHIVDKDETLMRMLGTRSTRIELRKR